jgi:uncharacterized protein YggE
MRRLVGAGALVLVVVAGAALRAQDDGRTPGAEAPRTERLSLTVDGHASVPADLATIELVVLAQGEDPPEAESLHRSKLRDVLEALDELKDTMREEDEARVQGGEALPPFTVSTRERESMVGVSAWFTGVNRVKIQTNVTLGTVVAVKLSGAAQTTRLRLRKRVMRIVETALDAGAEPGAPDARLRPTFRFEARDPEALRADAYQDALAKARDRATRLARLAGRELGPVAQVSETMWSVRGNRADFRGQINPVPDRRFSNQHLQRRAEAQGFGALMAPIDDMSSALTEIEIDVTLSVEFELGRVIAK